MADEDIRSRIHDLVQEEHRLRENSAEHTDEQRARIAQLEQDLDQLWDLLRQRQARSEYGQDPSAAATRSESTVEGYLQ